MANEQEPVNTPQLGIEQIEQIEKMPEVTRDEIAAKHQAYNDLIVELGKTVQTLHEESGSNSPDDESQEETQENQDRGLVANALQHARSELERLGRKLQE